MDIEQTAKEVESKLHDSFGEKAFLLESARLYGVILGDDGVNMTLLGQNPDVYGLLSDPENRAMNGAFDLMTVVTTGWAAPLNADGEADGMPSQHPERRRVRLSVVVNREQVASVLRFADDPDDVVVDLGSATGMLADALQDFIR